MEDGTLGKSGEVRGRHETDTDNGAVSQTPGKGPQGPQELAKMGAAEEGQWSAPQGMWLSVQKSSWPANEGERPLTNINLQPALASGNLKAPLSQCPGISLSSPVFCGVICAVGLST